MTTIKNFAKKHPLLMSIIVAIPFLWFPPISVIIVIVGIVFLIKRKKQEKIEKKNAIMQEANAFIEDVKVKKALPTVYTSLILEKDEKALLEENSALMETKSIRRSTGSGGGLRVMKGVYVGGYSGQSESSQEWRLLDQGTLTLTTKRIIFQGTKENRTIPLDKVMSINATIGMIMISTDGKSKPSAFKVGNCYIWATATQIAKAAPDPLNLGDAKIDIELK